MRFLAMLLACSWGMRAPAAFRAGAARADITPARDAALPLAGYAGRTQGFTGIHDPIHARALFLDDGSMQAAVLVCDLVGYTEAFREAVFGRAEAELGLAPSRLFITATHTHGAPNLAALGASPYMKFLEDAALGVLKQARANLKPARAGAGAGRAHVNVNRVAVTAEGKYFLGIHPEGPSDKTVAVVKFETVTGEPIALFVNYGVHGTGMGQENTLLTGDVPGATARYIEQKSGERLVALWTSGAAGDQCPIYDRAARDFRGIAAIGRILGEESIRVAAAIRTSPEVRLAAEQKAVTCPGQRLPEGYRRQDVTAATFLDGPPVNLRLSLLMIGKIALAGVSGEVLTGIGQRLKRESPLAHTILVTHTNGGSGYLPDDAAYERIGYEIMTARVKPGCAENAIVSGFVDLIERH